MQTTLEKRTYKRIGSYENPLRVRVKKLTENAVLPTYAHDTDAGMDLYAASKTFDDYGNMVIGTGIAVEIPKGYVGLVFPRSSICQHYCYMPNSVGVIDSDFRGEITFKFAARTSESIPQKLWNRLTKVFVGAGYRQHLKAAETVDILNFWGRDGQSYQVGDRIGQLIIMPYPKVQLIESDELSTTDRGTGGYGSTGK